MLLFRCLIFTFSLVSFSGCSIFPEPEAPPQLIQLTPSFLKNIGATPFDQLVVSMPKTDAFLDTKRLTVLLPHYRVDYYAGVSWTDSLPKMFQRLLEQTFETLPTLTIVKNPAAGYHSSTYILSTEIRSFSADYQQGAPPVIDISIKVELVLAQNQTLIKKAFLSTKVQAQSDTLEGVANAFAQATREILQKTVSWTFNLPPSS